MSSVVSQSGVGVQSSPVALSDFEIRKQRLLEVVDPIFPKPVIEIIQQYAKSPRAIIFLDLDIVLNLRKRTNHSQESSSKAMAALSLSEALDPQALQHLHALIQRTEAIYEIGIVIMSEEQERSVQNLKTRLFVNQMAAKHIIGTLKLPTSERLMRSPSPIKAWLQSNPQYETRRFVGLYRDGLYLIPDLKSFPNNVVECYRGFDEGYVQVACTIINR